MHQDELERLEDFRALKVFEGEKELDYLPIPGNPQPKIDQQPYYPVGSPEYEE